MKNFAILSAIFLILYMTGFIKKSNADFSFMSRNFTTAIKGFSILTVVWAHAGARLGVGGIQFIAGVGVALFLICSGYGLEISFQKNGLRAFWKKRFLKVCVPFWIVELVGLLITQQFEMKKYLLDAAFIHPATGYGWFMQYIVICYILFFGAKLLAEKTKVDDKALIITAFVVWFILDSLFFANPDMPFLRARQMLSFPLGMMVAKYKDKIEKIISPKRATALIISGGGITGIIAMGVTQLHVVKNAPFIVSNVLSLFTVLPLAITMICLATVLAVFVNNNLLLLAGTLSYELYLVHAFTLELVKNSATSIVAFVVVTVVLAYTLHFAMGKERMVKVKYEGSDNHHSDKE